MLKHPPSSSLELFAAPCPHGYRYLMLILCVVYVFAHAYFYLVRRDGLLEIYRLGGRSHVLCTMTLRKYLRPISSELPDADLEDSDHQDLEDTDHTVQSSNLSDSEGIIVQHLILNGERALQAWLCLFLIYRH